MTRLQSSWRSLAATFVMAALVAVPVAADRKGGGSVRQSTKVQTKSTNVSRNTRTTANVNRKTNVNVNQRKDVNVNVNRNVDVEVNNRYRRGGAVVVGEERAVAVGGRGGVAVVGEEGAVGVGRYGRVYGTGEFYEDNDGWKVAAGVATGIAVGTMLARPPAAATTVVVSGSSYYYDNGVYYSRVAYGGSVQYQVVGAPVGAVITTLPAGCTTYMRGGIAYQQCGPTYYQPMGGTYRVVAF